MNESEKKAVRDLGIAVVNALDVAFGTGASDSEIEEAGTALGDAVIAVADAGQQDD